MTIFIGQKVVLNYEYTFTMSQNERSLIYDYTGYITYYSKKYHFLLLETENFLSVAFLR